jgi:hypothetical protein
MEDNDESSGETGSEDGSSSGWEALLPVSSATLLPPALMATILSCVTTELGSTPCFSKVMAFFLAISSSFCLSMWLGDLQNGASVILPDKSYHLVFITSKCAHAILLYSKVLTLKFHYFFHFLFLLF